MTNKKLEQMKIISRQMNKPLSEVMLLSSGLSKTWQSRFLSRATWTLNNDTYEIKSNRKYPKLNGCRLPRSIPRLSDL